MLSGQAGADSRRTVAAFGQYFVEFAPAPKRDAWCHPPGVRTKQFLFDVLWSALIDIFAKFRSSLGLLSL
jgi:hypothetical protein